MSGKKTFSNEYVLEQIQINCNNKNKEIITEFKKIVPSLNDEEIINLYNKAISIRQTKVQNNGNFLENIIINFLEDNNIKYKKQVIIDNNGIIRENNNKCFHIIDFVIGNNINYGLSITNYIVISCKTTCRERWTQDNWTLRFLPKLYLLVTISNDYPISKRFCENTQRKIITCNPKNKDNRKFKLNFDNLITELNIS